MSRPSPSVSSSGIKTSENEEEKLMINEIDNWYSCERNKQSDIFLNYQLKIVFPAQRFDVYMK